MKKKGKKLWPYFRWHGSLRLIMGSKLLEKSVGHHGCGTVNFFTLKHSVILAQNDSNLLVRFTQKKIDIWRSIEMELRRGENQLLTKLTKSWKKIILCQSIKESDDNHCCLGKGGLSIVFCRSSGMTCTRANNNTTAHKIDWNQREK